MKANLRSIGLGFAAAMLVGGFATPASAQFMVGGFRPVVIGGFSPVPNFRVPGVGFNYSSAARFSLPGISFGYNLNGPVGFGIASQLYSRSSYNQSMPQYSSSMGGGFGSNPAAARNFGRAQQAAAYNRFKKPPTTRNAIYDQWAYERLGVQGLTAVQPGSDEAPPELLRALSNASEADIASGEALNHIVVGIVAAEKKGKADSAFLPPNLLAQVRFSGPPTAEAINLLRKVGQITLPSAFDEPGFAELKPALEKDLAAVAAPVLVGKPADPTKAAKLGADAAKARAILDPITRDLDFTEATQARRFLNNLDSLVKTLKGSGTSGLIDPRWTTEGVSVADLVKYMVRNKLLFGAVQKGEEDAYVALHRGLAGYLYVLTEGQKKPEQKKK